MLKIMVVLYWIAVIGLYLGAGITSVDPIVNIQNYITRDLEEAWGTRFYLEEGVGRWKFVILFWPISWLLLGMDYIDWRLRGRGNFKGD